MAQAIALPQNGHELGREQFEGTGSGLRRAPGFCGGRHGRFFLERGNLTAGSAVRWSSEAYASPARIGEPNRGISGLVDSVQAPRYAVPVGLALYGARQRVHHRQRHRLQLALPLAAGGWWSFYGPVLMSVLLIKISGVSLLEKKLESSRPGYKEYAGRTNAFFPWFTRSA